MFKKTLVNGISASAVVGLNAGYIGENKVAPNLEEFGILCQNIADKVMRETAIYIGVVISVSKTVYKTDWGCPVGGEDTISIEADGNSLYSNLPPETFQEAWKEAFLKAMELLMQSLDQKTVTAKFSDGTLVYCQRE